MANDQYIDPKMRRRVEGPAIHEGEPPAELDKGGPAPAEAYFGGEALIEQAAGRPRINPDSVLAKIRALVAQAGVEAKKTVFVEVYRKSGNLAECTRQTGIHRMTHLKWMKEDDGYRVAFNLAAEEATDILEWEARRRAYDGVEEPVFFKGEICGYVAKYSDSLLMFLLKANNPAKFRDRMEISNPQSDVQKLAQMLGLPEAQVTQALSGVRQDATGAAGGIGAGDANIGPGMSKDPGPESGGTRGE